MSSKEEAQEVSNDEYRESSTDDDEVEEEKAVKANAVGNEKKTAAKQQTGEKADEIPKEDQSNNPEEASEQEIDDQDAGASDTGTKSEDEESKDNSDSDQEAGKKRKQPDASQTSSKKQKTTGSKVPSNDTHGSKHDKAEEPAPRGSNERLPEKGQRVAWKAMPGWVYGKVLEVVIEDKDMQGKHIKASKDNPRIALEAESGKFCVHKPDNCYFEDND